MRYLVGGVLAVSLVCGGLCAEEPRIRQIRIESKDVFDPSYPEFDYWLFRFGNRLHVKTRDFVLRRELLFREGDAYDRDLVEESERNLRRYRFLTDVSIEEERAGDEEIDLVVRTEDQWTLNVNASLGSSGGQRTYDIGLDEDNFLGLGKRAGIRYEQSVERDTFAGIFSDPRLFGSRTHFTMEAQNSSDGHRLVASVSQPFFSQDAEWSYALSGYSLLRDEHLYFEGVDAALQEHSQQVAQLRLSHAAGARYRRFRTGLFFGFDENIYSNPRILDANAAAQPIVQDNLDPEDRRSLSAGVTVDYDGQMYVEKTHIDHFGRTEDLPRGLLLGGALLRTWNYEGSEYWTLASSLRWTFSSPSQYFVAGGDLGIRRQQGVWNNLIAHSGTRYYWTRGEGRFGPLRSPHQTLAAGVSAVFTREVDAPFQLSLGEEDGLRGYAFKSFTGTNRVIANLEHRILTSWDNKLIGFGIAPFLDTGYIWGGGPANFGLSVGIGARFGLKKYGRARVLRIDFAFPLVNAKDQRFAVSIATGHIFSAL